MMTRLLSRYLTDAASLELKRLIILELEPPCLLVSVRRLSASGGGPFTTELTSITGLMTISPEGGP